MGLKNGSEDIFRKFVLIFGGKIKAKALNIIRDDAAAQDIDQNVFYRSKDKIC